MHSKEKTVTTLKKKEDKFNNNSNDNINQKNNYNPPIQIVLTSSTSSSTSSLISRKYLKDKFEKLTAFHQICFSIAILNKNKKLKVSKKEMLVIASSNDWINQQLYQT